MPGIAKIQKEDIINSALELLKESNIDNIQARTLAKKLKCSTQPIFYQFNNMEEIKQEVVKKAIEIYRKYMLDIHDKEKPYKNMSRNYLKFAKEEPQLFKLLFMTETDLTPENFMISDEIYNEVSKNIEIQTELKPKLIKEFHLKMWVFTHGIACLIATNVCDFTYEQISKLLLEQYKSMMLLEAQKGNISKEELQKIQNEEGENKSGKCN